MSFQGPSEEEEFLHLEKRRPRRGWVELGGFAASLDPEPCCNHHPKCLFSGCAGLVPPEAPNLLSRWHMEGEVPLLLSCCVSRLIRWDSPPGSSLGWSPQPIQFRFAGCSCPGCFPLPPCQGPRRAVTCGSQPSHICDIQTKLLLESQNPRIV